jgi:uncharacterized protein
MLNQLSREAWPRIIPFMAFMVLLALRGALPEDGSWGIDPRWVYPITVIVVAGLLWFYRRYYIELDFRFAEHRISWSEAGLAILVGLAVFFIWIQLDQPWMRLSEPTATFRPVDAQGQLIWPLVAMRWVGAALLVPVMEELFWRSFLMRWLEQPQFIQVLPKSVGLRALLMSTFVFTLAHTLWLAAIIAGLAYAWLYIRTGKLWTAVIAHAVTNGALGIWVVLTGQWAFW